MVAGGRTRPGMLDVARLAGVSHQTVSRVLNEHPNVRESTRVKVVQAIEELGYRRNSAARALVTQRSGTLGIVTTGSEHYGPSRTLAVVERAAREAGYFVAVATAVHPTPDMVTSIFDRFLDQAVEGAVVIAPTEEIAAAARNASADLPVLMIAATPKWEPGQHALSVDQGAGARMVAEHLIELGHRDVVHVAGPVDWFDARARARGWHAKLAEAGIRARADRQGDWTAASGYAIGQALLKDLPTAIFASNDHMALGLLRAFAEAGVHVPGQVSVVGFDDVTGSDHYFPPLTTVQQDFTVLGRRALEALIDLIVGVPVNTEQVPPTLVPRASTGPARR
ncbi:LacI family DNA-binding transcriptional regulator [Pseudactinotalea sp. Z1732]|uniref:LacI family DNA-binding transcriptional regulator n=1 Tax=Micrococcales TaxID=85006 RepID=UPI003C7B1252